MQSLEDRDYFTDHVILKDPYAYFEAIRAKGPIYQIPSTGLVVVTGFDEILEVLKNTNDFSSVIAPSGPAAPLPFKPQGSDITPQIEAHRTEFVGGDLVVAYDDQQYNRQQDGTPHPVLDRGHQNWLVARRSGGKGGARQVLPRGQRR